jgi:HEAT repeat protein
MTPSAEARTMLAVTLGLFLAQPPVPSPLGQPPPAAAPAFPKEIGGKDLAWWIKELQTSADPSGRETAVKAIPLFGPDAREPALRPLLVALQKEQDPGVRTVIINTLGVIGANKPEEAKDIVDALALVLSTKTGPGSPVRLHVVRAMHNYGPQPATVSALLGIVADPSWETRKWTAYTLGRAAFPTDARGPSERVLGVLAGTFLKDPAAAVRLDAVQALILLGPPAYRPGNPATNDPGDYALKVKPYLDPTVAQLKVEKDKGIQIWLTLLVMKYDGSQVTDANVRQIANHVSGDNPYPRVQALAALAMLGPVAKPAVPAITGALSSTDPETLGAALNTVTALGETAKPAVPELEKLKAGAKDEWVQKAAGYAIDVIQGKVKPGDPPPAAPKK